MNRFAKIILLVSVSLVLIYGTIKACSDYWGTYFDSNFAPEAFVDDSYKPLFLSEDMFYDIIYDNNITTRFQEQIKKDWQGYFSRKLDTATVTALVFELTDSQLQAIKNNTQGKSIPDSLKTWAKKLNIKTNKIESAIDYLIDAKKVETFSTLVYNYWDYDASISTNYISEKEVKKLIDKYQKSNDSFLKNRYWYLVTKAWFYSTKPQSLLAFFNETSDKAEKNYLYYSALAYVAGVHYKNKNFTESNYLYSKVFDECLPMRTTATYNYHPLETQVKFEKSLLQAKNNTEKTALWALQGYYTDEIQAIESIYQLDPKSPHLDFLLGRVINKTEKQIYAWSDSEEKKDINQKTKEAITAKKFNLLKKIALENKTLHPNFWTFAIGYFEFLQSNFTEAAKYYQIAEKNIPQNQLLKDQIRLLKLINTIGSVQTSEQLNNNAIISDLHWLFKGQPEFDYDNPQPLRTSNSQKWIVTQLTRIFSKENNSVYKELILPSDEFYQNASNLASMKVFLPKNNKTKLESFLNEMYTISMDDIIEYEAIRATFDNKIDEAIALMEQTTNNKDTQLYANPFNGFIQDCHDCEFAVKQKKYYTKLDFLKTMRLMKEKISLNEDVYNNSLLLGNAFYNISHFGNARLFYQGKIIPSWTTPFAYDKFNRLLITSNKQSAYYYNKALESAENKEQKAKAFYMLAKCERNDFYSKQYYFSLTDSWALWDVTVNFRAWNGFKQLKSNYSDTKFYQQAINECGYFEKYVHNN